jgi:hypothetical protein
MIKTLRDFGLSSDLAYIAAMASIVMSIFAWATAKRADDKASAQRWGIFVGLWAPTFFELGNALKVDEES